MTPRALGAAAHVVVPSDARCALRMRPRRDSTPPSARGVRQQITLFQCSGAGTVGGAAGTCIAGASRHVEHRHRSMRACAAPAAFEKERFGGVAAILAEHGWFAQGLCAAVRTPARGLDHDSQSN